jgi:hypothetical protein
MVRTVERHPASATHLAELARSASTVSRIETGHRTISLDVLVPDWLFVLDSRILLLLGDRRIVVGVGEAAEFATMTPHAIAALNGPAEVVMLFDHDGRGVHLTASGSDSPV